MNGFIGAFGGLGLWGLGFGVQGVQLASVAHESLHRSYRSPPLEVPIAQSPGFYDADPREDLKNRSPNLGPKLLQGPLKELL